MSRIKHLLPKKNKSYRPMRLVFWGSIAGIILTGIIVLYQVAMELPRVEKIYATESSESSRLLTADGKSIHTFYVREDRTNVSLDDIPSHLIDALIAVEDNRFYQHAGIDAWTIPNMSLHLLTGKDLRGGSTLTMQLARNLFTDIKQDPIWKRKIKEYFLAILLERHYTKEQILTLYLNTVSFWGNTYGIASVSSRLYGKSCKDLSLEEGALLVGMLKATSYYSPYTYPERAKARRNLVIEQLSKYNYLDQGFNIDSVKAIPVQKGIAKRGSQTHNQGDATYFRERIRQQAAIWAKENDRNIYQEGLLIFTTLDLRMQEIAELAVKKGLSEVQASFFEAKFGARADLPVAELIQMDAWREFWDEHEAVAQDLRRKFVNRLDASLTEVQKDSLLMRPHRMEVFSWEGNQEVDMSSWDSLKYYATLAEVGFVALNPANGYVKAWVGGKDFRYQKYDHVAQSRRQPGSAFKPFLYGAAINAGYSPCDEFLNQPITIVNPDGTSWTPENADGSTGGMVTMTYALTHSLNIIAASLIKRIGPAPVVSFAHAMGIQSELDNGFTLALGTSEVSLLELTHAYASFADQGNATSLSFISRIEDKKGSVIHDYASSVKRLKVMPRQTANLMINMMEEVVNTGTASALRNTYGIQIPLAGKTGTSQENADGWFVGLTPNLAVGVWVGWSDRRIHFDKDDHRHGEGNKTALPIAAYFLRGVFQDGRIGLPMDNFPTPSLLASGKRLSDCSEIDYDELIRENREARREANSFSDFN